MPAMKLRTRLLSSTTGILMACQWALAPLANPVDGVVAAGSATIAETGKKLDVHQSSDKVVIDWRGFDIAADEHTQFYQPGSGSIALNRVNSSDPTTILGKLSANGRIIILN